MVLVLGQHHAREHTEQMEGALAGWWASEGGPQVAVSCFLHAVRVPCCQGWLAGLCWAVPRSTWVEVGPQTSFCPLSRITTVKGLGMGQVRSSLHLSKSPRG